MALVRRTYNVPASGAAAPKAAAIGGDLSAEAAQLAEQARLSSNASLLFTDLQNLVIALRAMKAELELLPGTAASIANVVIAKGQAVSLLNGRVILADASLSIPAIGVAANAAAIGGQVRFMLCTGLLTGLTGLTANSSVYLGNAGALLFVKPGGGFVQSLGFAISATELFLNVSQP